MGPLPTGEGPADVGVVPITVETQPTSFEVHVEFAEWNREYNTLVQEIFIYRRDGSVSTTLVEQFEMNSSGRMHIGHYDRHYSSYAGVYERRRMYIYPANTKGVDTTFSGFGQLPQNKDGSVKTNIPWNFNREYQWKQGPNGEDPHPDFGVRHNTQGYIVDDARDRGVWWEIVFDLGKTTVILPSGKHIVLGTLHTRSDEDAKSRSEEVR